MSKKARDLRRLLRALKRLKLALGKSYRLPADAMKILRENLWDLY